MSDDQNGTGGVDVPESTPEMIGHGGGDHGNDKELVLDVGDAPDKSDMGMDMGMGGGEVPQQQYADVDMGEDILSDENTGMWPSYCNPSYKMPQEIEVKVSLSAGDYYFPVIIAKSQARKAYLGGYRNKLTGAIYHHSTTQTPSESRRLAKDVSQLRCRETQTYELRTLSVQPYREASTQMERTDLLLDNRRDYELTPKAYFTSEQLLVKKRMSTVFLQRCWRGYMARCRAYKARESNIAYLQNIEDEKIRAQDRLRAEQDEAMHRRLHPQSNEDFAILYNELDSWRKQEVIKLKNRTSIGEERNIAMNALLLEETKTLQNIQKLKVLAQKKSYKENTKIMLCNMAKPHQWQMSSGETAYVQTPATQRAKELLDLFNALQIPHGNNNIDERLDCLLHVKWTVQEFDSPLTKDIADLADREADLLSRGRPLKSVEKLRTRMCNLFLEFIEDPKFNPRAADFINRNKGGM